MMGMSTGRHVDGNANTHILLRDEDRYTRRVRVPTGSRETFVCQVRSVWHREAEARRTLCPVLGGIYDATTVRRPYEGQLVVLDQVLVSMIVFGARVESPERPRSGGQNKNRDETLSLSRAKGK